MPFPKGAKRNSDGTLDRGSVPEEPPAEAGPPVEKPIAAPATRVGGRPSSPPRGKRSWDAPITQAEVQTAFLHLFVVASRVFHSEATWEVDEFADLAKGFTTLSNRLPPLRLVVVLISPLSVLGEVLQKVGKLRKGIPAKRPAEGRNAA